MYTPNTLLTHNEVYNHSKCALFLQMNHLDSLNGIVFYCQDYNVLMYADVPVSIVKKSCLKLYSILHIQFSNYIQPIIKYCTLPHTKKTIHFVFLPTGGGNSQTYAVHWELCHNYTLCIIIAL